MKTYDKYQDCPQCGDKMVCLAPRLDWDGVVRFACGVCDAWLIDCVDSVVPGGIWTYASRDGSGPDWEWLPESVRVPCAKAGLAVWDGGHRLIVKGAASASSKPVLIQGPSSTWASDGGIIFDLGVRWHHDGATVLYNVVEILIGHAIAPGDVVAVAPGDERRAGGVCLQSRYVVLMEELFPGCTWSPGPRPTDPVAVHMGDRLVGLVMPLADGGE